MIRFSRQFFTGDIRPRRAAGERNESPDCVLPAQGRGGVEEGHSRPTALAAAAALSHLSRRQESVPLLLGGVAGGAATFANAIDRFLQLDQPSPSRESTPPLGASKSGTWTPALSPSKSGSSLEGAATPEAPGDGGGGGAQEAPPGSPPTGENVQAERDKDRDRAGAGLVESLVLAIDNSGAACGPTSGAGGEGASNRAEPSAEESSLPLFARA
eukprot:1192894-Prorocentrum_minimum.AAC.1